MRLPAAQVLLLLLAACASAPPERQASEPALQSTASSVEELLQQADAAAGDEATRLTLSAINALLDGGRLRQAQQLASALDPEAINDTQLRLDVVLAQARTALELQMNEAAMSALQAAPEFSAQRYPVRARQFYELLGQAEMNAGNLIAAVRTLVQGASIATADERQEIHDSVWMTLEQLDNDDLSVFANSANSYELRGWIELARIYRMDQFSIPSQLAAVAQWRQTWTQHAGAETPPTAIQALELAWQTRPRHVALILPLQQPAGIAIQEGFLSAYFRSLELSREVPRLSVFDSSGATSVFSIYDEAVSAGADLIIGPLNKPLVVQLHQQRSLPVPTLALNYADVPEPGPDNLYQYALAPEDEIEQTAVLAWQRGHRNAAVITPGTEDYLRLQETFARSWTGRGGRLVSRTSYDGNPDYADVIKRLLAIDSSEARAERLLELLPRSNMSFTPRRRGDIDFIFLIANPRQGRQIKPTLAFYFAEDLPVFSLPSINDGLVNPAENLDLDGIVFTDAPWLLEPDGELKEQVDASLRQAQGSLQRLRAMGVDSFMLYARLGQFKRGEISAIAGATGHLTMSGNQQIHRQLRVARFENGLAQPLANPAATGDD
ncbi:MAG: penicillin-binding protein activator [Pseudohongiellaceae bacterium]